VVVAVAAPPPGSVPVGMPIVVVTGATAVLAIGGGVAQAAEQPAEAAGATGVLACISTVAVDEIEEVIEHGEPLRVAAGGTMRKTPAASKWMSQGLTTRDASRSCSRRHRRPIPSE